MPTASSTGRWSTRKMWKFICDTDTIVRALLHAGTCEDMKYNIRSTYLERSKCFGWRVNKSFLTSQSTVDAVYCQLHTVSFTLLFTIPTPHDCFPVAAMHRILLRRFMLVFWHQERSQLGGSKKSTLRCTPFSSLLLTIIYYKHLETCQIQVLDDFPTARTGCPSTLPRRLAPQQIRILGKIFDGMIIMGFWDNTMFDGCKELTF